MSNKHAADSDFLKNLRREANKSDVQDSNDTNVEFKTSDNAYELKLKEKDKEIADNEDRIIRLVAEFDNFKKRSAKEREGMYDSVLAQVVGQILPVIDNLEKACQAHTDDEKYKNGIEMVLNQFKQILENNNVKEIKAVGYPFDPSLHEAISMVVDKDLGEKIVKEEYRKGYTIGDKVIRHSLVVVAN